MDVAEVKLESVLERNRILEKALEKEKEQKKLLLDTISRVTQHNIALCAELKGLGLNINLIG